MTISEPSISISVLPANESISTGPQRVLFVGQMKTGTASDGVLVENVGNEGEEDTLFGANSMLAGAIRAFRAINKITRVDVIPLTDASGTNASGTVAFTGPSTEIGTLYVTVGSYTNHRYTIDVTSGMSATQVGDALVAAITADTNAPFTAVNTTGSVAITYAHDGLEGNHTNLRVEGTVAGIGVTVTGFASGATQPASLTSSIWTQIATDRYQTIVWPTSYTRSLVLDDLLDDRWNVTNDVLDGVAVQTIIDTKANIITAADALNSQSGWLIGAKKITDTYWKGNCYQEFGYVVSAQAAAIRSLRLTEGADISDYVITNTGSLDIYGGPAIASLPYFNTPLNNLPVIPVGKGFTPSEIEELQDAGVSVFGNNRTRTKVIMGEQVTLYKTDSAGNAETTFKNLEAVDTASTVREYMFNNYKAQYAQSRLTTGDLFPNRNMANKKSIEGFSDKLYSDLAGPDYVLLQNGETARRFFKANRSVTINLATGRATLSFKAPIVTQLRELVAAMQITFSVA